ncbi:MAG TPA: hypothetical protein DIC34_14725 [Treponema sp.]|nr:MAG: hypothetical protein A2Y36_07620 [Treponema sp. GWA1_62_8]OHE65568.1 MAG: hypothetical protein A2001_10615 [Treponema sp. GWC1_61_84]OHE68061.1 MAG: hypothetical protein A2413_12810 [Treponema sp. RIFOXYC1_FULL_61_9]HCM27774.1 hypothetical protein [Treponema sp.]
MTDSEAIFGFLVSLRARELSVDQLMAFGAPLGITATNLRSSLSRMAAKGLVEARKEGKRAFYSLAPKGQRIGGNVGLHFREPDWSGWDGSWWGAFFSMPEAKERYALQKKLAAYRLRPLYPGFWARPYREAEGIGEAFASRASEGRFELARLTFERAITRERAAEAFGLEAIAARLAGAAATAEASISRLDASGAEEAFAQWMRLGHELVNALALDPLLPPPLLPEDWPGPGLRARFSEWAGTCSARMKAFVAPILGSET